MLLNKILFRRALGGVVMGVALSACTALEPVPSVDHDYTVVLKKAPSNKMVRVIVECLEPKLKEHFPSASVGMRMQNFYEGKIPGTQANLPRATFDIFGSTGDITGYVTLRLHDPNDAEITELFKSCL